MSVKRQEDQVAHAKAFVWVIMGTQVLFTTFTGFHPNPFLAKIKTHSEAIGCLAVDRMAG